MNKITKYIALSTFAATAFSFAGCAKNDTNKELAKKIETESTELIYSIETMDNIRLSDLDDQTVAANATYTLSSYKVLTENTKPSQSRMQGANPKKYQDNSQSTATNIATTAVSETNSEQKTSKKVLSLTTNDFGNADEYSNELVSKRSEVMLLCSKLRKGDIKLSKDEFARVNECITLVNDTADYLESSKGKIEKDYKNAKTTAAKVALREKLAIRQAKLQTGILAMDEIIDIMGGKNKTTASATKSTQKSNNTSTTAKTTNKTNSQTNTVSSKQSTNTNNSTTKTNSNYNTKQTTTLVQNQTNTTTESKTEKTNKTSTQDNDAVSIVVQPIKTSTTTTATTQKNNANEFIVRRPRSVSNKVFTPSTITSLMPEPLPKSTTIPYRSSQNNGYSV